MIGQSILEGVTTGCVIFVMAVGYVGYLAVNKCAGNVLDLKCRVDALEVLINEDD